MVQDGETGKIWMSTKLGLTRFDPEMESFEYFPKSPFGSALSLRNIFTITPQGDDLLICTSTHLIRLNFKESQEQILFDPSSFQSDKPIELLGFVIGKKENDFIYSKNGFWERNRISGKLTHHSYDPQNQQSLAHNDVISMLQTDDGALWAGTRNGLSTVRFRDAGFVRFGKTNESRKSLQGKGVRSFAQHKDSLLLVCTSEGIEVVNLISGNVSHIDDITNQPQSEDSKYMLSMYKDINGIIWAGSRGGGLTRFMESDNGKFNLKNNPLNGASIQSIMAQDSLLWLGSNGQGLIKFSKEKGLLQLYPSTGDSIGPSHPYVFCMLHDSHENFWLGTPTGGVNLFDPNKERFVYLNNERQSGLSGNTILCFFQDSADDIWIGTTTGLSKLKSPLKSQLFDRLENGTASLSFQHYGREAGFPNEVIYGIIEDQNGFLWISTNDGLVQFDPTSETIVNTYHREDGCQIDEYNQNAFITLSDSRIAFGGVSGFQLFHPEKFNSPTKAPKVVLTKIEVNKQAFVTNSNHADFTFRQNDISFKFAALSFVNPDQNEYRYRLRGYDDVWYPRSSNRLVTFTNLDPGLYEFEVMAASCDSEWNHEPFQFKFSIAVPPWLSWYAFLFYVLLVIGLAYLILKWRTWQVRKEERRKADIQSVRIEERELFRKRSGSRFS